MGELNFENIFSNKNGENKLSPEDIASIEEAMKIGEANEIEFEDVEKESKFISFEDLNIKEKSIIESVKEKIINDERLAGRTVEDYQRMGEFLNRKYFTNVVFIGNKLENWRRNPDISIENAADNLYKSVKDEMISGLEKEFPKFN